MSVQNIINPATGKIDNSYLDLGVIMVPTLSSVLDGGNKANKEIDMSSNYIINCKDPVNNQDVATKKYVDDNGGGGNPSTWSLYPATQTVNLSDNYISASGSQKTGPYINIDNNIDGMGQAWTGLRLNSIKEGNQNKSLTFSVGDGIGKISSQWEGYLMETLQLEGSYINLNALATTLTGSLNFQIPNLVNNCNQIKAPIGGDLTLNCDGGGNLNFMFNSYNRITTDQNGIMTFITNPRCSEVPTLTNQLVNKNYVDSRSTFYNGYFIDTTIQTNISSINYMSYNTTIYNNGIDISNVDTTKVNIRNAGLYNIQFSGQFVKSDAGLDYVDIWLIVNNTPVPNSNTRVTLNGNNDAQVASWNFFHRFNINDNFQLAWYSPDSNISLTTITPSTGPTRPDIPSIILSVNRISL